MDATRGIIGADAIAKMRDGVVLVNVSRGELMDTDALIEGVETEKIGSLAMDVFAEEDGIYHVNRTHDILANRNMAYLRQFPQRHPDAAHRVLHRYRCGQHGGAGHPRRRRHGGGGSAPPSSKARIPPYGFRAPARLRMALPLPLEVLRGVYEAAAWGRSKASAEVLCRCPS